MTARFHYRTNSRLTFMRAYKLARALAALELQFGVQS